MRILGVLLVLLILTASMVAMPIGGAKIESSTMGSSSTGSSSYWGDPPEEPWILMGYTSGSKAYEYTLLFYKPQTGEFKLEWQIERPEISCIKPHTLTYLFALVIYRDTDKSGNYTEESDTILLEEWDEYSDYGYSPVTGGLGPFYCPIADWSDVRWLAVGFACWSIYEPEDSWWKDAWTWRGVIIGIIGIGIAVACITTAGSACVAIGILVAVLGIALSIPGLDDLATKIEEHEYALGVLAVDGSLGTETLVSSTLYGPDEGKDTLLDDWPNAQPYEVGEYVLHTTVQRFNKIALKFSTPQDGSVIMWPAVSGLPSLAMWVEMNREWPPHEVTFEVEMDRAYQKQWLPYIKHTPDGIPILEFDLIVPVDYEIYDTHWPPEQAPLPLLNQQFKAEWKAFGVDSQATGVRYSQEKFVHIAWLPDPCLFPIRDWIIQILESRPYYFIDLGSLDIVILSGEQPTLREEMVKRSLSAFSSSAMQQNPYGWVNGTTIGALIDPDGYEHRRIASEALPTVTKRISVPDPNNTIVYAPELHDFVLHIEQGPISPLAGILSIPTLNSTGFPASVTLNITSLDDPLKILAPLNMNETNAIYLDYPDKASVIIPKLGNASVRIPGSNRATEISLNSTSSLNHTLISLPDPETTATIRMPNVLGPVTISLLERTATGPVRTVGIPSNPPYNLSMFIDVNPSTTNVSVFSTPFAYMDTTSVTLQTLPLGFKFNATSYSNAKESVFIYHVLNPSQIIATIDLTHYWDNDDEVVFYTPSAISSRDKLPVAGWITRPYDRVQNISILVESSTLIANITTETLPHGLVLGEFDMPADISLGTYNITMQYVGNDSIFGTGDDKYSSTNLTVTSDPTISNVRIDPESPTPAESVSVYADVDDDMGVASVALFWKTSTQPWFQTSMSGPTGKTYSAIIGNQPDGTVVQFYVKASDTSLPTPNIATSPPDAPIVVYSYTSSWPDTEPPEILEVEKGRLVSAKITDNVGIEVAALYWKTTTETRWHLILMRPTLGDQYTSRFAIPKQHAGTTIQCCMKTSDHSNNTCIVNFTITISVGGIWIPVDKLALLAPYIALASTILVATAATAIYVKRVKHRKKKQ